MPGRWRHSVAAISVVVLAATWLLPAVDIPGRTLTGFDLIRLCAASGVDRLTGGESFGARALGGVLLLAISSNLVVPLLCVLWKRVTTGVAISVCVIVLGASVYLTLRVLGEPGVELRFGAGLWYAAMLGLLHVRHRPEARNRMSKKKRRQPPPN